MITQYVIAFIVIYLFASIPWGFILGKTQGVDIREHGSKNVGATNVNRVLGKKWALLCFFLDFLKGLIPVLVIRQVMPDAEYATVLAAFAAFAGHVWTIYLKFKGGKGIATSAGIITAISWPSYVIPMTLWIIVFYASRYVSLASVLAAIFVPIVAYFVNISEIAIFSKITDSEMILLCVIAVLAVVKHSSNIKRLLNGTESRFEKKKKEEASN